MIVYDKVASKGMSSDGDFFKSPNSDRDQSVEIDAWVMETYMSAVSLIRSPEKPFISVEIRESLVGC